MGQASRPPFRRKYLMVSRFTRENCRSERLTWSSTRTTSLNRSLLSPWAPASFAARKDRIFAGAPSSSRVNSFSESPVLASPFRSLTETSRWMRPSRSLLVGVNADLKSAGTGSERTGSSWQKAGLMPIDPRQPRKTPNRMTLPVIKASPREELPRCAGRSSRSLLSVVDRIGAHDRARLFDLHLERMIFPKLRSRSGIEGQFVIRFRIGHTGGDPRRNIFGTHQDLAAALVGNCLQSQACRGHFLLVWYAVEECIVVFVARFRSAEQAGWEKHIEGYLGFSQRGRDLHEIFEKAGLDGRVIGAKLLVVEQRPTGTEPDEDNAARNINLQFGKPGESADGGDESLVQAVQFFAGIDSRYGAWHPHRPHRPVVGIHVAGAGNGMEAARKVLEFAEESVTIAGQRARFYLSIGQDSDRSGVSKSRWALAQKGFNALTIVGKIPRRIVYCVQQQHHLGWNRSRFAIHGSKGYDGPRLPILHQHKILGLESGDRIARRVRHFHIKDDTMLGPEPRFSFVVRSRNQSRRLIGLRPAGLAAEGRTVRRQQQRKTCGEGARTPRPRQSTLPPAQLEPANPRTMYITRRRGPGVERPLGNAKNDGDGVIPFAAALSLGFLKIVQFRLIQNSLVTDHCSLGSLQQLGHFLLHAVGLGERRDARLAENLVLRHVRSCRRIVRGLDGVLCRHDVLLLRAHHLADRIQGVDLCADVTVLRSHIGDRQVKIRECRLRIGCGRQIGRGQIDLIGRRRYRRVVDGRKHRAGGRRIRNGATRVAHAGRGQ